jgi:signal transduction histidine kinase/ligand-binding sensor domain-containing protein
MLAAMTARAQRQYQIESWTTDDGLPQNTVLAIVQTPDGYLWFTTLDGLVRYDGVRFTVFNKQNTVGLSTNRLTDLIAEGNGDLWIGTENGVVTRYHNGSFQTHAIAGNSSNRPIGKLIFNNQHRVVAFTDTGAFQWDGEKFTAYAPVAGETKDSHVLWSKTGAFWYSDGKTIHRVKDGRMTNVRLPGTWGDSYITGIFEDSRGRLWLGTMNAGLFVLDGVKLTAYTVKDGLPGNNISPRIEDRSGNLWAVTNSGAAIISPDGKVSRLTTAEGLSDNTLSSIYPYSSICEDREGNIWIGSLYRGLNRVTRQSVRFFRKQDGLQADVVNPIYQTREGDILIGGKDLTRFADKEFTPFPGDERPHRDVTSIYQDRRGRLWFGNWGSGYYYENGKFTDFTNNLVSAPTLSDADGRQPILRNESGASPQIFDIHEDRAGNLWFASNVGVFRQQDDHTTRLTTRNGLAGDDVKVIHESPDGTLWFGTYGGLTKFKDNRLVSFTTDHGLASNQIRSLYEDAEGVLWIGSYDNGLTRLKDNRFTRYTTRDGLFNDGVFQILEDEHGYFWMSCNRGIYRVAKQQLNDFADGKITRIESIALGKADGLLETECNGGQQPAGIRARDGKLWFPTQNGVAVIDPSAIQINNHAPPVHIESFALNGAPATAQTANTLEIAPDVENVEIAYTGLSFVKPEQMRFRYKLDGLDSDWVEAGTRRTAYYSHLPPGEYTFTVIAANADGVWNMTGANVRLRVTPPFYRTWWFLILFLTLALGTPLMLYRRRVTRLEQAGKAQEEFSRKLLMSQEQERQRIAAELHDSIGQSLLIIKNRAFLALTDLDEPETVREQLEELSESATGAIEECREISYNLRPYQINRFGLTKTLEAIFSRISEVTAIKTTIELDSIDNVFSAEAETNIYRVVQESVNNIIKHSEATSARFTLHRSGDVIEMIIQDDGRGFDKNGTPSNGEVRGGFGLVGMAERVRMLAGVYEIRSQVGSGTSINIKLPLAQSNERN